MRNRKVDASAALTSGIHLLVLFLNLIHLAARQTSVACWKGFTCVMDATVKNAKVNMRQSGVEKKRVDFLISKVVPMYHQVCNLTLLFSVITFSGRTTAGRVCHGLALIFKTGHGAAEKRPVSLMTVCRHITYTKTD